MCAIPSPCSLDPSGHDLVVVAFEVLQVHFDAGLLVFAEKSELADIDILEIFPAENILQLPLFLLSKGFRSTDERDL